MIVDSFLFFQELDLLEIRLEYLYPVVDKFIIIEAKQSFNGSIKDYVFEKNMKRYKKYIDKLTYYKIEDIHYRYKELIKYTNNSDSKIIKKIGNFIKGHKYYDKENISHILDTYHRECIHIPLSKTCHDDDIILLSDLDEIPQIEILRKLSQIPKQDCLRVFVQHEFQYFLNNYANSDWYGTIIGPYKLVKNNSLNLLRKHSNKLNSISDSGYHFTSIGNKKAIKNKIESWGHQEYNHKIIKENIEENLVNGKDIFYRFKRSKNKILNIEECKIIDESMAKILLKFKNLFIDDNDTNILFNLKYFYYQILFILIRIIKNPKKFIKKIYFFF